MSRFKSHLLWRTSHAKDLVEWNGGRCRSDRVDRGLVGLRPGERELERSVLVGLGSRTVAACRV